MDRRYLVATLALAATFAIFSREFRSGHLAKFPTSRTQLQADVACVKHYVAAQVMAKLEPYLDRATPEQAQMVAELNLPELVRVEQKVADAQILATEESAHQKCEVTLRAQREAMRAQKVTERAMEVQIRNVERAQRIQELAVVRAQELSERATERAQKINVAAVIRAQEATARAMQKSQCSTEKSRSQMLHSQTMGAPIHINFQVPAVPNVSITAPAAPVAPTSF
jgi:hypothetical protein